MSICTLGRTSKISVRFCRFLVFAFCTICTLLTSFPSSAQQKSTPTGSNNNKKAKSDCPSTVPAARKNDAAYLGIQGVNCFEAGNYSRAYALYNRAYEISPTPTLHGAIGRVLHELGVYSLAAVYYKEYLELSDSDGDQGTQMIHSRLTQLDDLLEQEAGTIFVTSAPSNATVFMVLPDKGWLELGQTPLKVDARTDQYELIVVHDGFYRQTHKVNLNRTGKVARVDAELVTESSTFDVTARQWRRAGVWTIASGAPVFVTGVTLLFLGHNETSTGRNYSMDTNGHTLAEKRARLDHGDTLRTWGIVTTSIGTTAILTGAIFYAKGSKGFEQNTGTATQKPDTKTALTWSPILGFEQIGVQLTW